MMRPLVALCGDGAPVGVPCVGAELVTVAGLCGEPGLLRTLEPAGRPLVVGLCVGSYSLGAFQRELRGAGVDPLGVEIVHVEEAAGDPDRLAVMLGGAAARAAAFPVADGGHQAKLTFPRAVSRRSILRFSVPEYVAAPAVAHDQCASLRGCRACVQACPRDALAVHRGQVIHDRNACDVCGRCVTACPTGAMANPAATSPALEAQVRALVDERVGDEGGRGIVFRCRRASRLETAPGWYPVTVPCTGMLTEQWMLAPLTLGASAVAVRTCGESGCPLGGDDVVRERLAWCTALLEATGHTADRLLQGISEPPRPLRTADVGDPFGPDRAADVVLALAAAPIVVDGGPLGLVEVDPVTCTGCAACATSCPTGALSAREEGEGTELWFDAHACTGCGVCVARCPEVAAGAIRLRRRVDCERLRSGPARLWAGAVARCSVCGATIAPRALLDRFVAALGDERLVATLADRCADCRSVW